MSVTISSGQTKKMHLVMTSGDVCRIDGTIFFDTARSFIYSRYKLALEQAFFVGLTASTSGTGPVPAPERFLLITGHTDQVGSAASNQQLSERRARAALAVFTVDVNIWEDLYQTEHWDRTRGDMEIIEMFGVIESRSPSQAEIAEIKNNSSRRLDLIQRYLEFLRPDWIPQQSPSISPSMVTLTPHQDPALGCGFRHPRRNAPGTAMQENRRVEFFYFRQSDPGMRQCPSSADYSTWQATCGQSITVQIEVLDEYNAPYAGTFDLTLPNGVIIHERTDRDGTWTRDNLPAGFYTISVNGWEISELPSGQISNPVFDKYLSSRDNQIRIQVIDVDKWFIPWQNPLSVIPQFTRGNTVEPLIDGQSMMAAIHDAITSTSSVQHYIYITGWRMDENTRLLGATHPGSEVLRVLINAIGRGVDVRALLWDALLTQNTDEQEQIDDATRTPNRGQAILDNETLNLGSHHQKTAVVKGPHGLVAFCGGIDLAIERWDTTRHTVPDRRRENHPNNPNPWHDVHTRIHGPATGDIETNFRERWNNHPDHSRNGRTVVPTHSIPSPIANASHLVQTLRTFPPQHRYPFAPRGELGILNAYRQAISNAREYIYIEDQYLVFDEISAVIERVLRSLNGKVIIVIPRETDEFVNAFHFHRFAFIDRLRRIDASKIEVYHLTNLTNPRARRDIYVHAKLMIIDDIWAIIGSANINRRCMTHDSEIDIAVIDGKIENGRRKFARNLRKSLWAEHLGVGASRVDDPIASISLWSGIAAARTGHIAVYPRPIGSDSLLWNSSIDPDGR